MNIIDRRLNPKSKSLGNRQRFIKKARSDIRESVKESLKNRSVSDGSGTGIKIKSKSISEPTLSPDYRTGDQDFVLPGNTDYHVGDIIEKPSGNGSGGEGSKAGSGEGEDDFDFNLTYDEYLDVFFEDLKLPNLTKKNFKKLKNYAYQKAGFTTEGSPSRLSIPRSMRKSQGRRIALGRPSQDKVEALEQELKAAVEKDDKEEISRITLLLKEYYAKRESVPFLDPIDLQYSNFQKLEKPTTQAVMFCIIDVSVSMTEEYKDLAKRFFMLLHVFLKRHYKNVEVVFIRHTEIAKEVDETEFFSSIETGGTLVSSALKATDEVIKKRYNPADWNIYVAQSSDGDNLPEDDSLCVEILKDNIIPNIQYFAYIEVHSAQLITYNTSLWRAYETLKSETFALQRVSNASEIFPVFHELFSERK